MPEKRSESGMRPIAEGLPSPCHWKIIARPLSTSTRWWTPGLSWNARTSSGAVNTNPGAALALLV